MPNIAIVGTEGSGKTVFIATLAKRFSADNPLGVFMDPQGRKTVDYVERVWHTLSHGEWPASTSPGELFDLRWTIHTPDGLAGDIRLVDCAGQDLRLLFADEQEASENIPSHLKELAAYCRSADIVLFMINLKDFIGESDDERRTANQWAIKYAMDTAHQNRKAGHVALVFTQTDQYQDALQQHGDWRAVVKEHLPYVYGAHLREEGVATMAIAAVSDTQVVTDGSAPRRVPARNFGSIGLDEMVTWIGQQLRSVSQQEQPSKERERVRAADPAPSGLQAQSVRQPEGVKKQLLIFSVMVICFLLFLCGTTMCSLLKRAVSSSASGASVPVATVPIPIIVSKDERDFGTLSLQSFGHEVTGRVENRGASGLIEVRCTFKQAGRSDEDVKSQVVPAGWHWDFTFDRTADLWQNDGAVTTDVSADVVQSQ